MIPLNDFSRQWRDVSEEALAAFAATGESGWYILGREVREFEDELAAFWHTGYAVGVASGLDALEIGLRCLGCKPGDKVLTTPVSAFATTLAVLRIGAVPVFVDTDECGLIDLSGVRHVLSRDESIRFFLPVHLFGHALNACGIRSLREDFGVEIIEDCAQSIGATSDGLPTGAIGRVAATSFYPTKNLGALGDAGAVLTSDESCANSARVLRDYGQTAKYRHDVVGLNSRIDELQAAFLRRVSLPRLREWTARRREIASAYLAGIHHDAVKIPLPPNRSSSCWHLFPVLVAPGHKSHFVSHLKNCGISTGEHYPIAVPDQRALSELPFEIAETGIETARTFCKSEISLPIHPYLLDTEIARIVDAVNSWKP